MDGKLLHAATVEYISIQFSTSDNTNITFYCSKHQSETSNNMNSKTNPFRQK